jgi:hypothetical protein
VRWEGDGLKPVGYGYDSVEGSFAPRRASRENPTFPSGKRPARDRRPRLIATPANSAYNELVTEAARMSISNGGRNVRIRYGDSAGVEFA